MSSFKPFRPRHRIALEKAITETDTAGGRGSTWREDQTVWAEFVGLSSDEVFQGQQERNRVTAKCRIRFREGMTATGYRVTFKGRTFNIDSLYDPDEGRKYWYMRLVEVKK